MYLSGRGALLNKLPEYLSETQRLNIDYLDPLKSVLISEKVDDNMRVLLPYVAGEPIGLACAVFKNIIGKNLKTPINLLPENKLANLNFKKKVPILLFTAAIFSCIPLVGISFKSSAENHLKKELLKLKSESRRLKSQINDFESLEKTHEFTKLTNQLLLDRNTNYFEKSKLSWWVQDFLNQLQSSLDHSEVKDTWFDELYFEEKSLPGANIRNQKNSVKKTNSKIILIGRYLVRSAEITKDLPSDQKRDLLIELNSKKQEALTQYLETLPYIEKVDQKTFSIEGEGDLFTRYFTHFKYVFTHPILPYMNQNNLSTS